MTPYDVVHLLNKFNRFFQVHSANFEGNGNLTKLKFRNQVIGVILSIFSLIFQTISTYKLLSAIGGQNIIMDISRVLMYFSIYFTCCTFWLKSPAVRYAEMSKFIKNMKNIDLRMNSNVDYGYVGKHIYILFTLFSFFPLYYTYGEIVREDFGAIYLHVYLLIFIMNNILISYVTEARLMNIQGIEFNKELLKLSNLDGDELLERISTLSKVCEKIIENLDNFNKRFGLTYSFIILTGITSVVTGIVKTINLSDNYNKLDFLIIAWTIQCMGYNILSCFIGERLRITAEKRSCIVVKMLLSQISNENHRKELFKMNNMVLQTESRLKVENLFFVDNTLLYLLSSTLVSYTIILLQF